MISPADATAAAAVLAALAEPTRLRILYLLARGPHHVGGLAELLGVPIVNTSHHLGIMRRAGLVEGVRDGANGQRVVYGLRPGVLSPGTGGSLGTLAAGPYRVEIRADARTPARPL